MGVPKFVQEFLSRYSDVFIPKLPDKVSSLSIDFNGLIHQAAQKVYAYGRYSTKEELAEAKKKGKEELQELFFGEVVTAISELLQEVRPYDTLIMAVDGVVPLAKQWQQRQRRYRASLEAGEEKEEKAKGKEPKGKEEKAKGEEKLFDSNLITPGTPLMSQLDQYLLDWLALNRERLPPNVFYSSFRKKGEGEHLIMEHFRSMSQDKRADPEAVHVVYGLDADLIILSLISPAKSIFLYRNRSDQIVDIQAFRGILSKMFENSPTYLHDFVVMTFFLGNDFLPATPAMLIKDYSLEAMIKLYNSIRRKDKAFSLTKAGEVLVPSLSSFIGQMDEKAYIQHVFDYSTTRSPALENSKGDLEAFESQWYSRCFTPENRKGMRRVDSLIFSPNELKRYELLTADEENGEEENEEEDKDGAMVESSISAMCQAYLKTLIWNYQYYTKGMEQVDFSQYYPYYYAPTLQYLARNLGKEQEEKKDKGEGQGILHQLLNVLPPSSLSQVLAPSSMRILSGKEYICSFPASIKVLSNGLAEQDKHLWIPMVSEILPGLNKVLALEILGRLDNEDLEPFFQREEAHLIRQRNPRGEYERMISSRRVSRYAGRGRGAGRGTEERALGRGRGTEEKTGGRGTEERALGRGRGRGTEERALGRGRGTEERALGRGRGTAAQKAEPSSPLKLVELQQSSPQIQEKVKLPSKPRLPSLSKEELKSSSSAKEVKLRPYELVAKTLATHPFFAKEGGISSSVPASLSEFIKDYQGSFLTTQYHNFKKDKMFKWNTHVGQLKLLATLLQSWMRLKAEQAKKGLEDKPILLVYIGSAPGTNIDILWELGFSGKILCIDPNFHIFKKKHQKNKCYVGLNAEVVSSENWDMVKGIISEMKEDVMSSFPSMDGSTVSYSHPSLQAFKKAYSGVKGDNKKVLKFMLDSEFKHFIYQDYASESLVNELFNAQEDCVLGLISDIRVNSSDSEFPLDPDVIADQDLQWKILSFFMNTKAKERLLMYSFKFRCPFFELKGPEIQAYQKAYNLEAKEDYKHPDLFSDAELLKDYPRYLRAIGNCAKKGEPRPSKLRYVYCATPENLYFQVFPGAFSSEMRIIDNPANGIEYRVISQSAYEAQLQNYNLLRMYARSKQFTLFVKANPELGACHCWDCSALNQLLAQLGPLADLYPIIREMLEVSQSWQAKGNVVGLSRLVLHGTHSDLQERKMGVWLAEGPKDWKEVLYVPESNSFSSKRFTQDSVLSLKGCKLSLKTPVGSLTYENEKACPRIKRVAEEIQRRFSKLYH